jgi:hypothetical protein
LTVEKLAAQILERGHVVTLAGEVSSQMAAAVLGNAGVLVGVRRGGGRSREAR